MLWVSCLQDGSDRGDHEILPEDVARDEGGSLDSRDVSGRGAGQRADRLAAEILVRLRACRCKAALWPAFEVRRRQGGASPPAYFGGVIGMTPSSLVILRSQMLRNRTGFP